MLLEGQLDAICIFAIDIIIIPRKERFENKKQKIAVFLVATVCNKRRCFRRHAKFRCNTNVVIKGGILWKFETLRKYHEKINLEGP